MTSNSIVGIRPQVFVHILDLVSSSWEFPTSNTIYNNIGLVRVTLLAEGRRKTP